MGQDLFSGGHARSSSLTVRSTKLPAADPTVNALVRAHPVCARRRGLGLSDGRAPDASEMAAAQALVDGRAGRA
jgi:hypothetical protein